MALILYRLGFSNGKAYIGQTVRTLEIRMQQHEAAAKRGSPLPVHCAWRKYGAPNVAVLGRFEDPEQLHAAEIAAIADQGTLAPQGYNLAFGGGTAPSKSPEVAKKISERTMGRPAYITAERRKEISAAAWTEDSYRQRQTEAQKVAWSDPDYRARQSKARKSSWEKRKADGWTVSEEAKAKLRARVFSEETRAKMSAAAKARKRGPVSDQTREKLSQRTREAWQDSEITAARVASIRAAYARKAEGTN